VIGRADRIGDFLLEHIGFVALRIQLITSLEGPAAAPQHLVMARREGVKEMIITLVIFDWGGVRDAREGASHPHTRVVAGNGGMARPALFWIDVGRERRRGTPRAR